ncbi:hypothetical protein BDB01DRAFT_840130 [Pilobolus umbonatus]|nr:hypothetical protein BDB01DRAFT_840130 [Pilobolus umbonatus]
MIILSLLALATALESIWLSHWDFIFNNNLFTINNTLAVYDKKCLSTTYRVSVYFIRKYAFIFIRISDIIYVFGESVNTSELDHIVHIRCIHSTMLYQLDFSPKLWKFEHPR